MAHDPLSARNVVGLDLWDRHGPTDDENSQIGPDIIQPLDPYTRHADRRLRSYGPDRRRRNGRGLPRH